MEGAHDTLESSFEEWKLVQHRGAGARRDALESSFEEWKHDLLLSLGMRT